MSTEPPRPTAWSLSARITGLVIGVAVLVALLGALVSLRLLRTTVTEQARDQLSQQVAVLSDRAATTSAENAARQWIAATGDLYAVVAADGAVTGTAARYVTPEMATALLAGEDVSDTTRVWRAPVILEGRPSGDGGIVLARPNTVINTSSRALVVRIFPALLLGVLVAALAGAWLARRITRPLVDTAHAATRLAAGERGVQMPESDIPDVREVADALAALDSALATSEGRQRDFLLSISHEIRTPLTAMRGYAEALTDGVIEPDQVPAVGRTLQEETDRLGRFVTDLLELARLEADDFALSPSRVDLRELLTAAEATWWATANGLGVRVEVVQPPEPVVTTTDARRVRQVIDGLVENALRVSPEGSSLVLSLSLSASTAGTAGTTSAASAASAASTAGTTSAASTAGTTSAASTAGAAPTASAASARTTGVATIAVRDSGPGLSDDDLAHAFERGRLHERYRNTRPVGTGLGLSIAERLTTRLGGSIAATRAPGGGSEFSVRLPLGD